MADVDIQYVRSDDQWLAYAVVGDGEVDLVWVPPIVSNLDVLFDVFAVTRG